MLLYQWESSPEDVLPDFDDRNYIDVDFASTNPHKIKQKKVKKKVKKKPISLPDAKLQPSMEEKEIETKESESIQIDKDAEEQQHKEEERILMEQSLAHAAIEEQDYRQAITNDEKALAYVSQIKRDIVQNWSRPPSARNGMETLLRVYLVPTGELVEVVIEETSGNEAFDRSAVLAVEKAEPFQVPDDAKQFERNFRQFTVLFRPEDLRL